jgi:hypothetical protein
MTCTLKIEWIASEWTKTFKVAGHVLAGATSPDYAWFDNDGGAISHGARIEACGSRRYPKAIMRQGSVVYWRGFSEAASKRLVERQPNRHRRYSIHVGLIPEPPTLEALCVGANLRGRPLLHIKGEQQLQRTSSDRGLRLGDRIEFTVEKWTDSIEFDHLKVVDNIIDEPLKGLSNEHIRIHRVPGLVTALVWIGDWTEFGAAMGRAYAETIRAAGMLWVVPDHVKGRAYERLSEGRPIPKSDRTALIAEFDRTIGTEARGWDSSIEYQIREWLMNEEAGA